MRAMIAELFKFRDLLFWLTVKEIKVRYKVAVLGVLWAIVVPLALSGILWLVFSHFLRIGMTEVPYFIFLMTGMFPWTFFSQSVSQALGSILDSGALIQKTAFPRILLPLSIVLANFVNFLCALLVAIIVIALSGWPMSAWLSILPLVVLLHAVFVTGISLLVAGLYVRYRDVKYVTEVVLILWFYITPIIYPTTFVDRLPAGLQILYLMNPALGITELYRLALLGTSGLAPSTAFMLSASTAAGALFCGLAVFRRHEPNFADWVAG